MNEDKLIELSNISVSYGQKSILTDINLLLKKNEITTLIGPNGAGKSTLVRVVLGIQPFKEGNIWRQSNLKIGFMPQKMGIPKTLPLSVYRFLKLDKQRFHADIIEKTAKEIGISHLLDASVHQLSGGEWQRVLLAKTLLTQPELLVLDEPMQGIDVVGQKALNKLIVSIRDRLQCAILLVSHDLHFVMSATDIVVCLNGHVCCSGTPKEVQNLPNYHQFFQQGEGSDLLLYQHQHDHSHDSLPEVDNVDPSKKGMQ